QSDLAFLTRTLNFPTPNTTLFVLTCFTDYIIDFLSRNPDVLDPDIAHIIARVGLTMTHPPTEWLWLQGTVDARQEMGQEGHATVFMLRVLEYLVSEGLSIPGSGVPEVVGDIHRWLCELQSLWLGNGVWFEDAKMEAGLRAIGRVLQ
ncbi:hypothetical protein C8A05DRAFT_16082, partial [Staphylotrichum tortipilum]